MIKTYIAVTFDPDNPRLPVLTAVHDVSELLSTYMGADNLVAVYETDLEAYDHEPATGKVWITRLYVNTDLLDCLDREE